MAPKPPDPALAASAAVTALIVAYEDVKRQLAAVRHAVTPMVVDADHEPPPHVTVAVDSHGWLIGPVAPGMWAYLNRPNPQFYKPRPWADWWKNDGPIVPLVPATTARRTDT